MQEKEDQRSYRHMWQPTDARKVIFIMTISVFLSFTGYDYATAQERPLDRLFEQADIDRNGLLSEQEYHAAMQERFNRLDTNKDGNLSREEVATARQNMRERLLEHKEQGRLKGQQTALPRN